MAETTAKIYQNYLRKHFVGNTKEDIISIGAGITAIAPEFEEDSEDFGYYDLNGGTSKFTKSVTISYAFEGHRKYGDAAQDFMREKLFKLDQRDCYFRVIEPDGTTIEGPAKISDVLPHGGEANDPTEFQCTISFDGLPTESKTEPAASPASTKTNK
ncbi:phage tail tube protein [Enterococcus sp. AZ163]|uniref:phage tail tube protein n=1 Tax=Enterococcus sp. AZ163 TaxID=2774638 RepID=UPI003D2C97BC